MSKLFYNPKLSYKKNLENPPVIDHAAEFVGKPMIRLMGHKIYTPTGVAAGNLPDSNSIIAAVRAAACIVTYKTVGTRERPCHPFPNCVDIEEGPDPKNPWAHIIPGGTAIATKKKTNTQTNSFGIPSISPYPNEKNNGWMADVAIAQEYIDAHPGRMMIVSVVGTPSDTAEDKVEDLANDYALAGVLAQKAGARVIELNLSCPNVRADLGSIYQDYDMTSTIIKKTRNLIGDEIPLLIKVGYYEKENILHDVVEAALDAGVTGFIGINTISMIINNADGTPALPGRTVSGVCGEGIQWYARNWLKQMVYIRKAMGKQFIIGSCGGIMTPNEFDSRLRDGANLALAVTSMMKDPNIFINYSKRRIK